MSIHYRVGSERLTEEEYKAKYPDMWAGMEKRRKWAADLDLEPVTRDGSPGDRDDFRRERDPVTGMDGRYMPQLARYPGDPKAVVGHVSEVLEYAKRNGLNAERH